MNREIKFRAWDKDAEMMFEPDGVLKDGRPFANAFYNGYRFELLDIWEHGVVELMQYTGLKDRNGKEIYEGDIVKYKFAFYRDISVVEFNQDTSAFEIVSARESDDNTSMRTFRKNARRGFDREFVAGYDFVEIIGNIYENLELLEVEQ